jgi:hypothetical protein
MSFNLYKMRWSGIILSLASYFRHFTYIEFPSTTRFLFLAKIQNMKLSVAFKPKKMKNPTDTFATLKCKWKHKKFISLLLCRGCLMPNGGYISEAGIFRWSKIVLFLTCPLVIVLYHHLIVSLLIQRTIKWILLPQYPASSKKKWVRFYDL